MKIISSAIVFFSILFPSFLFAGDNLKFDGELVRLPCIISSGDDNISLNFGNIVDKYLYANERTLGQRITIHLINCDSSLAKVVHISFSGVENNALPGYLKVNTGSVTPGFAIGIEGGDNEGVIGINHSSQIKLKLEAGFMDVTFNAFVRGEPQAIVNRTINRGAFNAIVNFNLTYE